MSDVAQVAIPGSRRAYFDYAIPSGLQVEIGQRVLVPLGRRTCIGMVVGLPSCSDCTTLKPLSISEEHNVVLDASLWQLSLWMSQYYHVFLGEILQLLWPSLLRKTTLSEPWLMQSFLQTSKGEAILATKKPSQAQRKLLEHCTKPMLGHVLKEQGVARKTLDVCLASGWVEQVASGDVERAYNKVDCVLNAEQTSAVEAIWQKTGFAVHLLHGVTGSGKTEVYCEAILRCLAKGQQALVLVPEIGLTEQTVDRFRKRCGIEPCVLHSHLTDEARWANWSKIHQGKASLCIGTRSAVLAPFPDLGLIIIDEEHDASYKQQSGVRYHARDVAVMRAKGLDIPIVLGSATPSLESLLNADKNRYRTLSLSKRAMGGGGVRYHTIDMRGQKLETGISQAMKHAIAKHLKEGEQVLVFINRRGYAPVSLCHSCGHTLDCPHCDAHLAWHASEHQLRCHHCGYKSVRPSKCPSCQGTDWIEVGVGTQRLEEAIARFFPEAALLRIDRDSTQSKGALDQKLSSIHKGEAQILIGTQMIAKGHDFDNIGLVVLVDVDAQLYHPDFRAREQFAQLLVQVAGRAGRRGKKAQVLLQTHHPSHPELSVLMQEGYATFASQLLATRKKAHLPPYHHHAILHIQSTKQHLIEKAFEMLRGPLSQSWPGVEILGPMPSLMRKKAGYMQYQVVFTAQVRSNLHQCLASWVQFCRDQSVFSRVRWFLDVDPL